MGSYFKHDQEHHPDNALQRKTCPYLCQGSAIPFSSIAKKYTERPKLFGKGLRYTWQLDLSLFGFCRVHFADMCFCLEMQRWINHWIGVSGASSINFPGMISPLKSTWLKSLYNILLGFNSILFLNFNVRLLVRKEMLLVTQRQKFSSFVIN